MPKNIDTISGEESYKIHIVYLILAHGDAELLDRLICALDSDRVRFFVHIDAKSDIHRFEKTAGKRNVTFITDRVKVYWGGYSMVEATLRLMAAAINDVSDFAYAVLLSGAHYPIKTNDYIMQLLQKPDVEYLQYAKVGEVGCAFKVAAFSLYDYKLFNPRTIYFRSEWLNQIARMPGKLVNLFFRIVFPLVYKRKLPGDSVAYTGANWWSLTKPCVEYILAYIEDNSHYAKFFRYSIQPDETFFHTIVCNSHFKLANRDITLGSLSGNVQAGKYSQLRGLSLTFTKCSKDGSPKVLEESDFQEISQVNNYYNYPQLFARKFDLKQSSGLLQLIDNLRMNRSSV